MPNIPNPIVTPAILPTDLGLHQDESSAKADDSGARKNDLLDDEDVETPEIALSRSPMVSSRDEPDVRRLLNSYSPSSR